MAKKHVRRIDALRKKYKKQVAKKKMKSKRARPQRKKITIEVYVDAELIKKYKIVLKLKKR